VRSAPNSRGLSTRPGERYVGIYESREALVDQPSLQPSQIHVAFFLSSFGDRPFQSLDSMGKLFKQYLSLGCPSLNTLVIGNVSTSAPVNIAIDALALGHFGTTHAHQTSIRQSFQQYGFALRLMSSRLQQTNTANHASLTKSEDNWQHFAFFCLVMAFWEVLCDPPVLSLFVFSRSC
jgi:hypothetical protein